MVLGITEILFSKLLKVKEIEIRLLVSQLEFVEVRLRRINPRSMAYYYENLHTPSVRLLESKN